MVKSVGRKNTSKSSKRKLTIVSTLVILCVIALTGILFILFYVGSTKEIVAVADQFKPDSSWELVTNDIQPPKAFCGDVECPRVLKQWKTDSTITRDKLSRLLRETGWNFNINGSCTIDRPGQISDSIQVCTASGVVDQYDISVSVTSSNPPENSKFGLIVTKKKE